MKKEYQKGEDKKIPVAEPAFDYNVPGTVHMAVMPCTFNEESLDEEIRLSEASGYATDEAIQSMFSRWGVGE